MTESTTSNYRQASYREFAESTPHPDGTLLLLQLLGGTTEGIVLIPIIQPPADIVFGEEGAESDEGQTNGHHEPTG